MRDKICITCNGTGLVETEDFVTLKRKVDRCDSCGGYGYNKYKVIPVRSKKDDWKIKGWIVVTPNRDFVKIERSFDNAIVWMDIHAANYYGKLEVA